MMQALQTFQEGLASIQAEISTITTDPSEIAKFSILQTEIEFAFEEFNSEQLHTHLQKECANGNIDALNYFLNHPRYKTILNPDSIIQGFKTALENGHTAITDRLLQINHIRQSEHVFSYAAVNGFYNIVEDLLPEWCQTNLLICVIARAAYVKGHIDIHDLMIKYT